jgi:eukaryotic-like serine/threonine-protein kinase
MEYAKGVSFTRYCDDARLSIPERLALFVPVCQAVQHAHQKGIIHRDLQPSNILVCLYDGRPVPKVIDFGLAKAMHQPLTEHTLYTAHGLMLGTPLYMSPEQAELNNLNVDTRADTYSLGVLLYELLTGTTPLEKKQFKRSGLVQRCCG